MKLSYSNLDGLHAALLRRYSRGEMTFDDYNLEWDRLVEFAGWTWDEILAEIDLRWTERRRALQVNLC